MNQPNSIVSSGRVPGATPRDPSIFAGVRVPGLVDYLKAITDSSLGTTDKAVCFAILRFRNTTSGECFPSMATLAHAASLSVRATQKVLQRLASCGAVIFVRRSEGGIRGSGRGISHTLRLELEALRAMGTRQQRECVRVEPKVGDARAWGGPGESPIAPEPRAPVTSEPRDANPRTPRQPPTNAATLTPEPRAHKPSIEHTREPTIEPSAVQAARAIWMDDHAKPAASPVSSSDRSVRSPAFAGAASVAMASVGPDRIAAYRALQAAGVRGPNLIRLARCDGITAELVRSEDARLRADPRVTHPPGALVKVLAERAGVTLGRSHPIGVCAATQFGRAVAAMPAAAPPRPLAEPLTEPLTEPLDAATLERVRQIEQMRAMRRGMGHGNATAVGDLIR